MAHPPQDEDATLISTPPDEPTIVARTPQPAPPVPPPPRRRGTPWLVWLIIIGLFLLVCLASVAALLLFLRTDTLQTVQARLTAAALTAEALRSSQASKVGTPALSTVNATTQLPVKPGMTGAMTPSPTSSAGAIAMATPSPMPSPPTVGATSQPTSPAIATATDTPTSPPLPPMPIPKATPLPPTLSAVQPARAASPSPPAVSVSPTPTVQVMATGGDIIIAAATPSSVPSLGAITFSAVTQDGRTLEGDTFVGKITEIHALFTYQNMVDGVSWERRWYLDGRQMAKTSDVWNKGSTGTFHLTLSAGGSPLSSGHWRLELYVDGNLLQQGEFVIASPTPPPPPTAILLPTPLPSPTAAAIATAAPTGTPTAAVVPVYTIAFSRWDGGKYDLFLARTDGSGEKFLLQRAAGPSWSPDGRYLIFYGQEGVDRQERDGITYHFEGISNGIISMDLRTWSPDPSTIVLRQHVREATARWAAWSPRGDMVAYDARRGGPDWRIYFLGTANNQQYQVEIPGEQADWSPDGNYLVYRSGRENRQGIWVSNRDDSSRVQITAEGSDAFPRWSPDGRKIAFHRDSGQNVDIYIMNADGSLVRRLTDAPGPDTLPAWTPDGRIVFRSARSGSWGIYIMNADSSGQRLIIPNADPGPDWAFGRMDVR